MAVDWLKIRNEYVNGGGSYRKLAEKYGISANAICTRSKKEHWLDKKEKQLDKTCTRTEEKTVEIIANKEADRIGRLLSASDRLMGKLERAIDELDLQTARNKTKVREVEYNDQQAKGKPTKEIIKETEEMTDVRTIIDRSGLQKLAVALKSLKDVNDAQPRKNNGASGTSKSESMDGRQEDLKKQETADLSKLTDQELESLESIVSKLCAK